MACGAELARTSAAATSGAAPVVLLDASDDPSPMTGPAIASIGQLAAAVEKLASACRARETEQATLDACAEAQKLQQRGIDIELERYRDTRPWHIGAAIDALARRMTPDTFVISDVSNVKLWTPIQVPVWETACPRTYRR